MVSGHDHSLENRDRRAGHGIEALREGLLQLARLVYADESIDSLLPRFTELIYRSIRVDYVEILEHLPDLRLFSRRACFDPAPLGFENDTGVVPQELGSQAGYTLLRNQPVVVGDTDKEDRFDTWQGLAAMGVKSGLTVPVPPDSARFGVLGVYCLYPRDYSQEEVAFLTEAASYLAAVLVRYREAQTRKAAERRLGMVEEATLRAAAALDESIALRSLARLFSDARNGFAEVCLMDMDCSGDRLHRAAAAIHGTTIDRSDPGTKPLLYPQEPDCQHGPPVVLSSGQPDVITEVTDEHLRLLARDDTHLRVLRDLGPTSYMCVPIKIRRDTLGGLVLMSRRRTYTDHDARHAARLASIVGLAVAGIRARLGALDAARGQVETFLGIEPAAAASQSHPPISPVASIVPASTLNQAHTTHADNEQPKPIPGRMGHVLTLMLQGMPVAEIAGIMGTSHSAIYKHQHNLRVFFDAETTPGLVAKAHYLGYGSRG